MTKPATLLLSAVLALAALAAVPLAAGDDPAEPSRLLLDLTCVVPADGRPVEDGVLLARLYCYDPLLADVAADEVDRVLIQGVTHEAGADTILRFPMRAGRVEARSYYVTAFIYPGPEPDEMKRRYFVNGFQKVFEGRDGEALTIRLAPTNRN